ncbi:MAG: CDP-glycerol--glycerophosphate glycerophosphotransferase [Gammaproteobacteria bacterium]|nr:CDP-glycerol--glycerophosphate glycerophosphotransferase [Gammaproteobacteria bacterium]
MTAAGERVSYLTSDPDDPGLSADNELLRAFCIGNGLIRTICFQFLDAGVMLMTMVDFNKLQLKRSVNPVRYAFMFHSLISVHMADHADSYDDYDAVLCAGPHQMRELRKREAMLGQAPKQLFEHGYERLETLLAERRDPPPASSDAATHVLLAPSWGDETILNVCGDELVDVLIAAGFRVTLRPHYQTRWNTPEVIDRIVAKHRSNPQFSLIEQMGESDSLYDSHVMITDWSGAGMDYGMGLEKPVLYIDVPPKARNDWWPELGIEPFEMYVRDKIGRIASPDELAGVPQLIRDMLREPEVFRAQVAALRDEWVFNPGSSPAAAAAAVRELARQANTTSEPARV